MTDRLPFAGGSDVRALCAECGRTWPIETVSCPSCGTDLGGATVIDDPRPSGDTPPSAAVSRVRAPAHSVGRSSDPPTRFLRGIDEHIDLPPGSVVDDEYEIEAKLGEGAMGVVYRAHHTKLARRVAIKVIAPSMGADPQALGRFEREAKVLASLHHPNIVAVYSFGELRDARTYFTMELLSGSTLYERLQHGRVPIDEALVIFDQMAAALEAAHATGIVHRDLKPENTFLHHAANEPRAVVKIVDWGLARLAVPDDVERTASGAVIGTSLYISPEQARGPNVDRRTDVYALGVIGYELILGQHPFPHATTSTAAIAAHLTEEPPQPRTIWPEVPAELDALLPAMLAKNPNYRPTLIEVREVIAGVRSGVSPHMRAATAPVARGTRRTRAWLGALVTLALIVGIVIGARVLGGTSNRDASRSANTNPATTADAANVIATPKADLEVPDAVPTIDAGSITSVADDAPADAAVADTTPSRSRSRDARRATVTGGESPIDAGSPEPPPVVESTANTPVAPPKLPGTEKPPQRYVPPTPPPIDRDGTINPFKRGSAAR
jgi:serine/threonine-protein kinase